MYKNKFIQIGLIASCMLSGLAFGQSSFEQKAASALNAIPDKTDERYLDNFIDLYFGSKAANVAFSLRYNELKSKQVIEEYNDFIGKYSDTLAGQLAVQEVYELYAQRESVPSLIAFMDKYPGTAQSYAAKLKVHSMLFTFARAIAQDSEVSQAERLGVMDSFIDTNRNSPQVPAAILLAKAVAVELEIANRKSISTAARRQAEAEQAASGSINLQLKYIYETGAMREQSNRLATTYEVLMSGIDDFLIDESKLATLSREESILVNSQIRRAERAGFVLQAVYPDQDAAARVRNEQRYQKTAKILKNIQDAIYKTNTALIVAMREEFSKVSRVLTEGFGALDTQMRGINSRLDILHGDLEKATAVLQDVNKNIIITQDGLNNLASIQTATNQLLDKQIDTTAAVGKLLDNDLAVLHDSVLKLNSDLNVNAADQKQTLVALTGEVKSGFRQQHADSLDSMAQNKVMQEQVIDQFVNLRTTLNANFDRVVDGLGRIEDGIDHTNSLLVDVNGKLVEINGQLTDVNGNLMQIGGQLVDVNGQLFEIKQGQDVTNEQLVKVNGQLRDTNGHLIDLNEAQKVTNNQLGQVNQNLGKIDDRMVQQLDQSARQHYEALRFNETLNTRLVQNMERLSSTEVNAINSNGAAIRQNLGIINSSINAGSDRLEKAIYTGSNMVAERVDRGVAGLRQTIVEQSDRQVYQLTEFRNETRQGFASVSKSVNDFRSDFKTFSDRSTDFYGQALGKMDKLSAQANRNSPFDYQKSIGKIFEGLAGKDLKGIGKSVVLGYCSELSVSGEECESIVSKALDGVFDPAQLGSVAGRTVCERAKIKLSPESCGKLGTMIGQGKLSPGAIADVAVTELCGAAKIKIQGISCSDFGTLGSVATDIVAGDYGAAAQTVVNKVGEQLGNGAGKIFTKVLGFSLN